MDHSMRLQLMHYLFGLAKCDGEVHPKEEALIATIGRYMYISEKDYASIRAMFYKDPSAAYRILEIDEQASDDEIKKAFRKMAMKYHPDKNPGDSAAESKFKEIYNSEGNKKIPGMADLSVKIADAFNESNYTDYLVSYITDKKKADTQLKGLVREVYNIAKKLYC
jgi:hypothetical protein